MTEVNRFRPGALVRSRERDWVVIPQEETQVIRLRPVDGTDEEAIGVFLPLEQDAIGMSQYPAPSSNRAGDFTGALVLRDALRLALRNGAGPFRSMGRLSVIPRPYQFVPLIMALKMKLVRLLIADDVGVGKTIEAAMIARELMDRGDVHRIAVLCAPHLCDQWAQELRDKFNIEAVVIQPSHIARLERQLPRSDISIYQYYRNLVISIDYIKSDRNKRMLLDNAPDLIIVDEAHTAARPRGDRAVSQHQRYKLLQEISQSPNQNLILVTATPHSGIEESFRSLLGLLDTSFDQPEEIDLSRQKLVPYVVQRRRKDIQNWLGEDTPFPERISEELSYNLSTQYMKLFDDVLSYCRESVSKGMSMRQQQQRVRYWAAIAILRCLLSSPAAAEAMLQERSKRKERGEPVETFGEDSLFNAQILDSIDEAEPSDYVPSAPLDDPAMVLSGDDIQKLNGFLNTARKLAGSEHDTKLIEAKKAVDNLLKEGYHPIIYCRFIATAKYVAEQLQNMLKSKYPNLRAVAVTGDDGDSEQRNEIVKSLANEPVRVLVASECLSEGINLQEYFDAVLHYDLPWNPNRLEQREGRVDRYGQKRATIKTILLYGSDNPIDLTVLDVLIRKAQIIRRRLGISVPVPVESQEVVQAIIDSVLLRKAEGGRQLQLAFTDPKVSSLHAEWDKAAEREDKARAFFAQQGIKPDEVAREMTEIEPVLGSPDDVRRFVANSIQRFNGNLKETNRKSVYQLHPGDLVQKIYSIAPYLKFPIEVSFAGIPPNGVTLLGRNHPIVTTLSEAVISQAVKGEDLRFTRCGAIYTNSVSIRTGVLVLRLRYLIEETSQQFAEEILVSAFRRDDKGIQWLKPLEEEGLKLLSRSEVAANMPQTERERHVTWALDALHDSWYESILQERVHALLESHARLRTQTKTATIKVIPHTPPDILGCYILVPAGGNR
jgi:superfamily II DNA or RNA helicase